MLKIEKIEEKEVVEVLAQKDCSTKENPFGWYKGCDDDCTDPNHMPWYGSPAY
ncbi:hypothetical protein [Paraclostridium sordellii]|uniref:Uncharacterized protein n=1 Tax=Paraclostridium sordellii TaxID=1505 RepID=A0A9P1KXY1_PARSO|nr:hypothetical protein [Paeniclostridium sordellii]CEN31373.1 Uncharacterised protein [[Clostridium] sordellii] [Paeniclostridium sordellii]